jgi:hypothetical protein
MSKALEKAIDRALTGLDRPGQMVPDEKHVLAPPLRRAIAELAATSGVTERARPYLIRRMRYYLDKADLPTCPSELQPVREWLNRRAWDLLEEHHRQLPALNHDKEPAA